MQRRSFNIDFGKKSGKVKAMHGLNLSFGHNTLGDDPIGSILSAHAPSVVGLHDLEYPYGQNQYVDIHCVFPDFTKDPESEESYNFAPTDSYLEKIKDSGAEIIFRLGESTDKYAVKPFLKSPNDLLRFAAVCVHVVMHYNAKWANGYKWNIKYFEIWSGADSSDGYVGELNDYVELYTTVSKALKNAFPRIKVGGYSSLGFSAMNRVVGTEEQKGAYSFAERFLDEISKSDAPFDFFTWCSRASDAEELSLHTKYARSLLRASPYRTAKSIVSEFEIVNRMGATAAEYLASMIVADKSDVEIMLYKYSGKCEEKELADIAFSALYKSCEKVLVSEDYKRELYLSAADEDCSATVVVASTAFSGAVEIVLENCEYTSFDITQISKNESGDYRRASLANTAVKQNKIVFFSKPQSLYLLTLK